MAKPTARILALKDEFYNQYKSNKQEWVDKYKSNAEQAMVGAAFNRAKTAAMKEQKQRIKEMVKSSLANGPVEEINSVEYVQNRKPVDEKNPIDTVRMDIPLLIRVMEFAKEDAKTDMELHAAAENMIELSKKDRVLNMDDYNSIVTPEEENQINELVKKVMTKLKA
jgi:phenylalanyl-tRNA synthetase alpha subunit